MPVHIAHRSIALFLSCCILLYVSSLNFKEAMAEDKLRTDEYGDLYACVPRAQADGPWDCKIEGPRRIECELPGDSALRDPSLALVAGPSGFEILLRVKYKEVGNLGRFAQWAACNGFFVDVWQFEGTAVGKPGTVKLTVNDKVLAFGTKGLPWIARLSWYWWPPYMVTYELYLTESGEIERIRYTESRL